MTATFLAAVLALVTAGCSTEGSNLLTTKTGDGLSVLDVEEARIQAVDQLSGIESLLGGQWEQTIGTLPAKCTVQKEGDGVYWKAWSRRAYDNSSLQNDTDAVLAHWKKLDVPTQTASYYEGMVVVVAESETGLRVGLTLDDGSAKLSVTSDCVLGDYQEERNRYHQQILSTQSPMP